MTVHQQEKSAYIKTLGGSSPRAAGKEHGAEQHEVPVLGAGGETQMERPVKTAAAFKSTAFHRHDAARQLVLN